MAESPNFLTSSRHSKAQERIVPRRARLNSAIATSNFVGGNSRFMLPFVRFCWLRRRHAEILPRQLSQILAPVQVH